MQEFKVYEAEEKTTQSGKTLKKLVLQKDGLQYPFKNVTIWGDNPLYAQAVPGATITCDLLEKDSENINPNSGKPYVNRSVANPNMGAPKQTSNGNVNEMALKTHITQEIAPLKEALRAIVNHLGVEEPKPEIGNTGVEYPTPDLSNDPDSTPF